MTSHRAIIPWMGGKRRLLRHILPLPEHTCYVEPFAGSAALFFAKPPSAVEVINDVNSDLVTLYRCVKHHLDELIRQFRWALVSREEFLLAQDVPPHTLTDIQRAARFYYLQKCAFGAKVDGQNFGTAATAPPRLNLLRIEEDLSQAHLRLARTTVEHLPWAECVHRYDRDGTLHYLDPPYWQTEGYGVPFGWEEYERIAELARSVRGRMLISHVEHPDILPLFAGLAIQRVPIRYSVGGAGRSAERIELLIRNWT